MSKFKRIASFVLACVTTFAAVPVFALSSLGVSADPLAEKTEQITVSFRMPDVRGPGANTGTVVAERKAAPGFVSFLLPSEEECLMRGVDPDTILGWYSIDEKGNFRDAAAFSGTYLTENITFYPYLKSSAFSFPKTSNFPIYTVADGKYTFCGLRGGWSVGHYTANGSYTLFSEIPTAALSQAPGKYAWDWGGCYLAGNSGGGAFVLPKTNTGSASAISWTALVDGTVNLDFNSFYACTGGTIPAGGLAYLAVAHNDVIIWPESAAGNKVDTTGCLFAEKGWYEAAFNNTSSISSKTALDIPSAVYEGLEVKAGDTVRFIMGRGNFATAELSPSVTYTETTENYWDAIITEMPAYNAGTPFDSANAPICGAASDSAPEITYPENWELITYPSWDAIAALKSDTVSYYTKSGQATDFLTSVQDYGSDTAAPFLFAYDITARNTAWGSRWDIVVTRTGNTVGTGGFRYTADFTGYINLSFDAFMRSNFGFNCNFETVRTAVFVDGVMVWPTAGGDATDVTKWAKPFEGVSEKLVDVSDALNATLPEQIFVRAGQKVDILLTAADEVNVWNGAGNYVRPHITYSTAFATAFETYATLGETLTMNFAADAEGGAFLPSETRPYLVPGSLEILVECEENGSTVAAPADKNGKQTVTVNGIVARCMGDEITYRLQADVQMPDGSTQENVILDSGITSPAAYMKNLIATRSDNAVRDLALATLQYGAAAQRYFNYKTDSLVDASVDAALSFTLGEATDITAISGEGEYTFSGASLILGDAVKVKVFVNATAAPRADYAELYVKLDDRAEKYPLVPRTGDTDGSYLKAFVEIPYSEFSASHSFRVCKADGTVVSTTMTYNVDSYAVRMSDDSALAAVLTAIRALGQASANYVNLSAPTPEGNVVTRVALLSDLHVGRAQSFANEKLDAALKQVNAYFDGKTDLILFPGDLTHDGLETEYEKLVEIVTDPENVGENTRLGFVLGNHEFYRPSPTGKKGVQSEVFDAFIRNLGGFHDEETTNHMMVINGICFIGVSIDSEAGFSAETEAYLREQVEIAAEYNPDLPIIIYSHYGYGALWGTTGANLSKETAEFLKQYPQIVWFSGHTHEVAQDPRTIGQEYYTNVQLPTLGGQLADTGWEGPDAYNKDSSQGMFMTISDTNVIKLYRYDFKTGKQIGQTWTIDIPAILRSTANFNYKLSDRAEVAAAPAFAEDATVTVNTLGKNNAGFKIPLAHVDDAVTDDAVIYYHVYVMDKNNKVVATKKVLSEYYRGARAADSISFSVAGLTANTEYTLRVIAESAFEKYSDPLIYEFKTKA